MVLRLADALDIGLRATNDLLHAAGLAAAHPATAVDDPGLAAHQAAIQTLLSAHEPYPGMVVDAHWTVISANRAGTALFGSDVVGTNLVWHWLANPDAASMVLNWPAVAWAGLDRLRYQQARSPFDEQLAGLVERAEKAMAGIARPDGADPGLAVCPTFRIGDQTVRTIAMVARFDWATDITLDELRVELMYPADADAERYFRHAAALTP